jgi:hypothetical protein
LDEPSPRCERIAKLEQQARQLAQMIDEFQKRDPRLYSLLLQQIEQAVRMRVDLGL